ncbi:MAG: hypothetical protein H0X14_01375 [Acidobacteria bacterium]|nr:hypothetical protein [Acidobacteriota bacterium]
MKDESVIAQLESAFFHRCRLPPSSLLFYRFVICARHLIFMMSLLFGMVEHY